MLNRVILIVQFTDVFPLTTVTFEVYNTLMKLVIPELLQC